MSAKEDGLAALDAIGSRLVHKEDVKAALRKRFGSLLAFEAEKNLPPGSAKDVLRGRAVAQTERAIAEALNKPLHVIFPARYTAPKAADPSTEVDNSGGKTETHRLSARAG